MHLTLTPPASAFHNRYNSHKLTAYNLNFIIIITRHKDFNNRLYFYPPYSRNFGQLQLVFSFPISGFHLIMSMAFLFVEPARFHVEIGQRRA